jgi:hypothetical protein
LFKTIVWRRKVFWKGTSVVTLGKGYKVELSLFTFMRKSKGPSTQSDSMVCSASACIGILIGMGVDLNSVFCLLQFWYDLNHYPAIPRIP